MIIDTHCHYNLKPLFDDVDREWQEAQKHGVESSIVVGTSTESSKLAVEIANNNQNLYSTIGIHPNHYRKLIKKLLDGNKYSQEEIDEKVESSLDEVASLVETESNNKKLVGIGEIGLDYFFLKTKGIKRDLTRNAQIKAFRFQLYLALKNNLPIILHVRDKEERTQENAYFETLGVVKEALEQTNQKNPKIVLHCVSGPESYIKEALGLGAYIGVAGNITYDKADSLRKIVKMAPENKILLETDAPYLTPREYLGQECKPFMIESTAKFLEQNMGINIDIIKKNSIDLFFK